MDEQQTPAVEAGDEAVREDQTRASEATENTEGQEQDQPAEDEGNPESEEKVSKAKARRERRKAEMERIRQSEAEAKKRADEAEARLDRIRQAAQQSQPPKVEDFEDYNDYIAASGAFHAAKQWDDRQAREAEEEVNRHKTELQETERQRKAEVAQGWAEQVEDAKTRYADFEQVAYTAPISDGMAEMIATSDLGADVAYYLGTNRDEAARIAQMRDIDQARALGAIEARLSLASKQKTETQAPEPIRPVRGKNTAQKDPNKMSIEEYKRWRQGKT